MHSMPSSGGKHMIFLRLNEQTFCVVGLNNWKHSVRLYFMSEKLTLAHLSFWMAIHTMRTWSIVINRHSSEIDADVTIQLSIFLSNSKKHIKYK